MSIQTEDKETSSKAGLAKPKRKMALIIAAGVLFFVAIGAVLLIWLKGVTDSQLHQKTAVNVSGRIEVDQSRVASLVSGRVKSILIKEGDHVIKGQQLLSIEDDAVSAGSNEAQSMLAQAQKMLSFAQSQKVQLTQKMNETVMPSMEESKPEPSRGIAKKTFRFVTAPARLLMKPLTAPGAKAAQAERNIKMEIAKAKRDSQQLAMAQVNAQILMAQANVEKANSAKRQLSVKRSQYRIVSPITGVCSNLLVHQGDVVSAGKPLILINDPESTYVRAFIPESKVALVKLGQAATVFVDSGKGRKSMDAHVSSIDPKASFTPENVYFKDDRVKQVFGMKLSIDHPDGTAKAGMPCEADIQLAEPEKK